MVMKTVSVATLKQKLSEYLRMVENGDEIVITSHRRPVARLTPEPTADWVVRESKVPASVIRNIKGIRPIKPFSAEQYLYEDRRKR